MEPPGSFERVKSVDTYAWSHLVLLNYKKLMIEFSLNFLKGQSIACVTSSGFVFAWICIPIIAIFRQIVTNWSNFLIRATKVRRFLENQPNKGFRIVVSEIWINSTIKTEIYTVIQASALHNLFTSTARWHAKSFHSKVPFFSKNYFFQLHHLHKN